MAHIHLIYIDIDTGYFPGVNHGLASLASAVKKQGHSFSLQHLTSPIQVSEVVHVAKECNPDVVGFSFTSPQVQFVVPYLAAVNSAFNVPKIAGGIHPTLAPEEVLSMGFDGVAIGEADTSLPDLLSHIKGNQDKTTVPGFWWIGEDGVIKKNPIPNLVQDLDTLPFPDYSVFDLKAINEGNSQWISLMITRGCPYNCSFCCNHALKSIYPNKKDYVRFPSAEHAIKLIDHSIKLYSEVKGISFADDLLILKESWFLDFSERYKNVIRLPYTCCGRIEHFSDIVIAALRESGCITAHIGIESGSEWLRKYIFNRHMSNQQISDCFARLRQAGIKTFSYNIMGAPFETINHMEETIKLNRKIKPDMGTVFFFFPFPGTKLFKLCQDYDLLNEQYTNSPNYLEQPLIKEVHFQKSKCIRAYQKLRLFLASRSLVRSLNLPEFLGTPIWWLTSLFPNFFVNLITQRSKIKYQLRKWVKRHEG